MADRPMIFSAPMVRALLAGTKTQTRRVLKPQPPEGARYSGVHYASDEPDSWFFNSPQGPRKLPISFEEADLLWVRETWTAISDENKVSHIKYRATCPEGITGRWRSPIHMPRWASRLTLTVTDVRVERLQDISEADAQAEGVRLMRGGAGVFVGREGLGRMVTPWPTAREAYFDLWNSIHGPDAWSANPWIAALTFTVERRNVDAEATP